MLVQDTDSVESSDKSLSLKKSLGVLIFSGEKVSSGRSNVRHCLLDSPDLSLVSETVLSNELELLVETFLFEGSSWGL